MTGSRHAKGPAGYVMIAVALLIFPILMIAALVLDLGFTGHLQARMQTATDLAVREGPRGWRGPPTHPAWCADAADPACDAATQAALWDVNRRALASAQVAALHAPAGAGAERVGPPRVPALTFGGSLALADPTALALIGGENEVFGGGLPLAANAADAPDGDLVGGSFVGRANPPVVSCHDPAVLEAFGENCAYERSDFVPSSAAPGENRAFLVRMRTTGEPVQAGIAEPADAVPVLFGRFVGVPGDPGAPPLRSRGLRIRAVAIADARPALAASPPIAGGQGVANFGVDAATWRTLPIDAVLPVEADPATGEVSVAGAPGLGRVLATPSAVVTAIGATALAVPGDIEQPDPGDSSIRFVPLYRVGLDGIDRVVAFGVADVEAGTPPQLTKRTTRVETLGVTATPNLQATLGSLASAVIDDLFAEYREARACSPADETLALVCGGVLVR